MHVVESRPELDIFEERHPKDGKDEHDEEEEERDVDEGREGHHQREQECPNASGALDQTENATDFRNADLKSKDGVSQRWESFIKGCKNVLLTTLSKVGDTKYFSIRSLRKSPPRESMTTTKSNRFHGSVK